MFHKGFSDAIHKYTSNIQRKLPELKIGLISNVSLESIFDPFIKLHTSECGYYPVVSYRRLESDYKEDERHPDDHEIDVWVLLFRLDGISEKLLGSFWSLSSSELDTEIFNVTQFTEVVIKDYRNKSKAPIIWISFELPVYSNILSHNGNHERNVVNLLNVHIKDKIINTHNAYYLDINRSMEIIGYRNFYDRRLLLLYNIPFSRDASNQIAFDIAKALRIVQGRRKKCLILDCDNILWGGVIGEDGLYGINLGSSYPGIKYKLFQQEIKNLYKKGILLALCSKNNESDVMEVFRDHPDMVIKEEHIITFRINWEEKSTSIISIAEELRIGLEDIVFIDDSEFEINCVMQRLPEVTSLHFPESQALFYKDMLCSTGLFDGQAITYEDRNRSNMYRDNGMRTRMATSFDNMVDFYKSLNMDVWVQRGNEFSLQRIAQLSQRTNQFTLTARRYSEKDIAWLLSNPDYEVITLKFTDSFGEMGIVGVAILRYGELEATIESLFLSCRALSRNLEDILLNAIFTMVKTKKIQMVIGENISTNKNGQTNHFYLRRGFEQIYKKGAVSKYKCLVSNYKEIVVEYIQNINMEF
ncbi:HAD-IIIC family phosphatase [Paenibacillus cymbidii]|uniref:HAD-IIIC family phosphatase n=1 Tax=Paenibacillus cymbidii TaxID=1639034 RepID=UPI0010806FB0|nr:HAD-IIIC family phosphatase [Paenibacillus cymbidii]